MSAGPPQNTNWPRDKLKYAMRHPSQAHGQIEKTLKNVARQIGGSESGAFAPPPDSVFNEIAVRRLIFRRGDPAAVDTTVFKTRSHHGVQAPGARCFRWTGFTIGAILGRCLMLRQ